MSLNFIFSLAIKSLIFRRGSIVLSLIAISLSVFVLLGIEHIRDSAKKSFNGTIAGVDLIVGPRSSDLNLLLTTVFRLGAPSQNMSWQSYERLNNNKNVAWTIPIALGDSHRRFRVVGTNENFFDHYKYAQSRSLRFQQGGAFEGLFDVVLGAHVASELGYPLGHELVLSHGFADTSFQTHDAFPFSVTGILEATGTPVDNALYVSLEGLEAIHSSPSTAHIAKNPASVSAAMVGLNTKLATFKVQRDINNFRGEALSAILPGVALTQLWQITRGLESTLRLISAMVLVASLLGLGAVLLATVRERKTELRILRTLGAGPGLIFTLVQLEALGITVLSILIAFTSFVLALLTLSAYVMSNYGVDLSLTGISSNLLFLLAYVLVGALVVGSLPAIKSCLEFNRD